MFSFSENAAANPALHAQFDAQASQLASQSQRNFELLMRLSELNLQLARHAIETALDAGRQMSACRDPQQLTAVAMHGWQPLGEHLRNYQQSLMGVLAEIPAGFGQAALLAPGSALFAGAFGQGAGRSAGQNAARRVN
jgi:hypothetical protein